MAVTQLKQNRKPTVMAASASVSGGPRHLLRTQLYHPPYVSLPERQISQMLRYSPLTLRLHCTNTITIQTTKSCSGAPPPVRGFRAMRLPTPTPCSPRHAPRTSMRWIPSPSWQPILPHGLDLRSTENSTGSRLRWFLAWERCGSHQGCLKAKTSRVRSYHYLIFSLFKSL